MARVLGALAMLLVLSCGMGRAEDELQELRLPAPDQETVTLELQVNGQARSLQLRRHSLRSFDFQLLEDRGGQLHPLEVPEARTYVGEIAGEAGSRVGAIFTEEGMKAFIRDPDHGMWVIEPVSPLLHKSYRLEDLSASLGSCGVDDEFIEKTPELGMRRTDPEDETVEGDSIRTKAGLRTAELAFDADYELYEINGFSSWAVLQDIEAILIGVNVIYEAQLDLTHTVSAVIVRTFEEDPYSFTDAQWLLEQMADHWNTTHSDIRADLVHLMTGRDIFWDTIGLAYVGAACNPWFRYGLSETHFDTDLGLRTALTAHELGHNWGARHCDGDPDCYVMCSAIGSCEPVIDTFGSSALDSISTFLVDVACLEPAFPQVVYVDGSYSGSSSGSFGRPFTSVGVGVSHLTSNGLLVIRSGNYGEALMLQRPMLLRTYRGNSLINP